MPTQSFTRTIGGWLYALVAMIFWRATGGCEQSAEAKTPPAKPKP
jgi:hypothetical protein